ncbi:45974_t:CDS:2, partial [Gigaspora margarita]
MVCQTYKNVEQNTIETIYKSHFEAAAFCGKVKGIIKEAKQVAKKYDKAIQADLLEEELPDIFNAPLLAVTCRMASVIQSIESPSHHISTELNIDGNPNVSKITLAKQITHLEKDFILVAKSLGLDQQRNDMPTAVSFLTDGEVYNVDQIVELIKSSEEKKRDDLGKLILLINQLSFFRDKATPPPDTQLIFTDMKIQQAPFLIPPIYPGLKLLSAISQDGPMKFSILLDPVALQETKIHTLTARNHIQKLEEETKRLILSALPTQKRSKLPTSFLHKHPRNKGKNISDSLIREQIVKGSELVVEAKILSNQRIVPVTGANFSIGALVKVLCFALELAYLEIIMFETFKEESEMCYVKASKILKK